MEIRKVTTLYRVGYFIRHFKVLPKWIKYYSEAKKYEALRYRHKPTGKMIDL